MLPNGWCNFLVSVGLRSAAEQIELFREALLLDLACVIDMIELDHARGPADPWESSSRCASQAVGILGHSRIAGSTAKTRSLLNGQYPSSPFSRSSSSSKKNKRNFQSPDATT